MLWIRAAANCYARDGYLRAEWRVTGPGQPCPLAPAFQGTWLVPMVRILAYPADAQGEPLVALRCAGIEVRSNPTFVDPAIYGHIGH